MIVVTGEPRSGTSLAMQTLALLGVPVAGEKHLEARGAVAERARELNPRGFFETRAVSTGVTDAAPFAGQAIKLVSSGIVRTDPASIRAILLCLRRPEEVLLSQARLTSGIEVSVSGAWDFHPSLMGVRPDEYALRMGRLLLWVHRLALWEKIHVLEHREMLTDPAAAVRRLAAFLCLSPDAGAMSRACANIDPALYRFRYDAPGEGLAWRIYCALREKHIAPAPSLHSEIAEFLRDQALESATWFDDTEFSTLMWITPSFVRAMATDEKLRAKMAPVRGKRRADASRCPSYRLSVVTYAVERPADLGPLVRALVLCGGEEKTREACYRCWSMKKCR